MSIISELQVLREKEDHIEFKEAKHNYPFAGGDRTQAKDRRHCVLGYVVALANEKGGRLVLGMADKYPHKVVGSDFAVGKVLELEDEIYKRLHIRVHNEELYESNNRVLVINVPSRPVGKALRFEGVPLMRTSESLREMDDAEYFSILSEQDPDFSAKICEGLRLEDLDESAISEMRKLVASKSNNESYLTVATDQFISDLSLYREGKLTYAALILFARAEILTQYLPQYNVVVEYRNSHSQDRYTARKEFREPLVLAIGDIWNYINQPASNPLLHVNALPQILDVPAFNQETIREAILNACVHRSLQLPGDILIKQYPDAIEVINPGGFPYGVNIGNILTVSSSPRNRLLAETIEKTGWIERSGQGADIMFGNCIKEGKPIPDYSDSDDYQVILRIPAWIENPRLHLFLHSMQESLNAFELLNLYHIYRREVESLYSGSLSRLLDQSIIAEDPVLKYTLGDKYFVVSYPDRSERFGSQTIRLVYYATQQEGAAPSSFIIERLKDLYTQKQARTVIAKMMELGWLSQRGTGRATTYSWVD